MKSRRIIWSLLVVFPALVLAAGFADGQETQTKVRVSGLQGKLQNALDSIVASEGIPGATLAISLPDGKLISLASGFSDLESKAPMPVGGQMMAGSTGKTFVSAVALQLISEGKFKLDDRVATYFKGQDLSWYSRMPNADTLTIESLMNHTSGIPRYVFDEKFLEDVRQFPMKPRSPRECLAVLLDAEPHHAVGDGWGYSDSNYMLLGLIIEKVTGSTFYSEAKQRLLDPHQLDHTEPTTQAKLPGLIPGYIGTSNPFGMPKKVVKDGSYAINPGFEWCGGGFMTNVEDLATWMRVLHQGEVLEDEIYDQLVTAVDFRTGKRAEQGYGLGTFVWKTPLGEFVGHAGMMPGYLTQTEYSRDHKFSVAFQVNSDEGFGRNHHGHVQRFAKIVKDHSEQTE